MNKVQHKVQANKGFSLVELIIAIAILVILTGLLVPNVLRYVERSRQAYDKNSVDTAITAAKAQYVSEFIHGSGAVADPITYVYNHESGEAVKGSTAVTGYGRSANKLDGTNGNIDDGTVSHNTPNGAYVVVTIADKGNTVTAEWTGGSGSGSDSKTDANKPSYSYADNASEEQKAATDKIVSTYADAVTQAKIDADAWRGSGDSTYKAYYLTKDGQVVFQGSQSEKTANKNNAYKMETAGSATINGVAVKWNKGDIIAIGVRKNGNVEIDVKNIWGN